ncbi:MAG: replication-associated recombination protein A [Ignavibacteriales bacterium]|nr:replication-associated recombination protein A [Ignavibacteriales bacterium]
MADLFVNEPSSKKRPSLPYTPLAERVRPQSLEEFFGQEHLLGEQKPLRLMIESQKLSSMIFWGPPGSGKTTLARLISNYVKTEFVQLNAVSSGVKEVRDVIAKAEKNRKHLGKQTILFIDEIHRFNKAQQDALLHSVEEGVVTLIGATTENPSFEVISPLLSRCQVYLLEALGKKELDSILDHAVSGDEEFKKRKVEIEDRNFLMLMSGGDARKLLNGLETAARLTKPDADKSLRITKQTIEEAFQRKYTLYDKAGDQHYDTISAFIKSLRGSDPDAAIYWMARMLDGGEDIKFIARRMVILASEDIGNADPLALVLATSCFTAVDYVGMPEAQLILSQTAAYLGSAPKSNASLLAIAQAMEDVKKQPNLPVPLHIRNAPTKLMKELGYGAEYKYSHDYDGHFVEGQYLPDNLKDKIYYNPTEMGKEKEIGERLKKLWNKKRGKDTS